MKVSQPTLVLLACALAHLAAGRAQAEQPPSSPAEEAIRRLYAEWEDALSHRQLRRVAALFDGNASDLYKRLTKEWSPVWRGRRALRADADIVNMGVQGERALVHERISVRPAGGGDEVTPLRSWEAERLVRLVGSRWKLTETAWWVADILRDMSATMDALPAKSGRGILHLVTELRGGKWRPERYKWWQGDFTNGAQIAGKPRHATLQSVQAALKEREGTNEVGTFHIFVQRMDKGWLPYGGIWFSDATLIAAELETELRMLREELAQKYGDVSVRLRLADRLAQAGLYAEASLRMDQAAALDPTAVPAEKLAAMRARRGDDPTHVARAESRAEKRIGLGADHPRELVAELERKLRAAPTNPDLTVMLGIEYARLADDRRAAFQLARSQALLQKGAPASRYTSILLGFLRKQVALQSMKPAAVLRSDLFTVRYQPGDTGIFSLLAALERAQHAIYRGFAIPMSGTEVLLFPSADSFRAYTVALSGREPAEFTAAYTDGEQIVTYREPEKDDMTVVAHEYGHVALMRLARGNVLPDWLNEGVACAIQGGYWNYKNKVRKALQEGALLDMARLRKWDVQGQTAFLAYSEANWLVDFIRSQWGQEAILRIVKRIGGGVTAEAAVRGVLGIPTDELFAKWVGHVRESMAQPQ